MTKSTSSPLSFRSLFSAWLPLGVMWILMAVEHPAISAVISRSDGATGELAAFGFTFALALFIEGPVVQMLAAATALAENRSNYRRLLWFMHILGAGATAFHFFLALPPVFAVLAGRIFRLPGELIEPARVSFLWMLPWTAAVGYRRLWQGVLIRFDRTRVIPATMVARLGTSLGVLLLGSLTGRLTGAALGGAALTGGTVAGALAAWIYVRPVLRKIPVLPPGEAGNLSRRALALFYVPLALTNFLNLGARPLMNLGIARGVLPLVSLALWPVLFAYFFLFTSLTLSLQEIVIARLKSPEAYKSLRRFVLKVVVFLSLLFGAVLFTPLWRLWFFRVSGLSAELGAYLPLSLGLLLPLPFLTGCISLYRGTLVACKRTGSVTAGVGVNVALLLGLLFTGVFLLELPGVYIAVFSYVSAAAGETLFLRSRKNRVLREDSEKT